MHSYDRLYMARKIGARGPISLHGSLNQDSESDLGITTERKIILVTADEVRVFDSSPTVAS